MKYKSFFILLLITSITFSFSSCANTRALKNLNADEIRTLGENCEELYLSHFDAWDSRDPKNLRSLYTDDVVHFDGRPLFVGIEDVIFMADVMFDIFPDWQMQAGKTYISRDACVGTWINWDVLGLRKDNPGVEYDLLQTRDGKIYFWQLFYSQEFHDSFDENTTLINTELLSQFAAAWSSGDSKLLDEIYSTAVELEDTLFEVTTTGLQDVHQYADSFFAKGASTWELLASFSESTPEAAYQSEYPNQSFGGVFSIQVLNAGDNSCEIEALVVLMPDADGHIQSQKIYYNADSLITCGWAK